MVDYCARSGSFCLIYHPCYFNDLFMSKAKTRKIRRNAFIFILRSIVSILKFFGGVKVMLVIVMLNRSPTSQTCLQQMLPPTSVTDIYVTSGDNFNERGKSKTLLRYSGGIRRLNSSLSFCIVITITVRQSCTNRRQNSNIRFSTSKPRLISSKLIVVVWYGKSRCTILAILPIIRALSADEPHKRPFRPDYCTYL